MIEIMDVNGETQTCESIEEVLENIPNKDDITKILIMIDILVGIVDENELCQLVEFEQKLHEKEAYNEKAYGMLWANNFICIYDPEPPEIIELTKAGKDYRAEYWRTGYDNFLYVGDNVEIVSM
jgi:hypothetical protein